MIKYYINISPEGLFLKTMITKLINYLRGVRAELKQVNWPTRKQAINFTAIVIGVSLFVSLVLGLFDLALTELLNKFIL